MSDCPDDRAIGTSLSAAIDGFVEDAYRHHLDAVALPEHLRGDGPCDNCGTVNNIVWFTDNVFWNMVVRGFDPLADDKILCIPCFVKAVDERGFKPRAWRLLPDWRWTKADLEDA